jgi:hypothetical protein
MKMEMTDRELLELIAAKVGGLETRMDKMDGGIQEIKKTVINIENDHGEKLKALFDGYYPPRRWFLQSTFLLSAI